MSNPYAQPSPETRTNSGDIPIPVAIILILMVLALAVFTVWDEARKAENRNAAVATTKASWEKFVADNDCKLVVVDQVNSTSSYACKDGLTYIRPL